MKVHHHKRAFEQVFDNYDGKQPLHRYLLSYYRLNKQMGSSDRRWASRYMYSYFRLGNALPNLERFRRLAIADFLCNTSISLITADIFPEFEAEITKPLAVKITFLQSRFDDFRIEDLFPFPNIELSSTVDKLDFFTSHLVQPDLFIRVQAAKLDLVKSQLNQKGADFKMMNTPCLALPNGTKLEQLIDDTAWYQIQDFSSQLTGNYFKPSAYEKWWDCCAASGGKSLLLHSLEPKVQLLVSDVREASLMNLEGRFKQVGIVKYQKKVLDLLLNNEQVLHHYEFDGILLDAPCSGSGTWGRTPEMLRFFDTSKLEKYTYLQKNITKNVLKYLKEGKPLIYMTCSVFAEENEKMIAYFLENYPLQLEEMKLIEGYHQKADSMFVARLIKK